MIMEKYPKIYLKRYERIKEIGKGSFGTVYLVWDREGKSKSLKEMIGLHENINLLAIKKTRNNENMVKNSK